MSKLPFNNPTAFGPEPSAADLGALENPMLNKAMTVSQLNRQVKRMLEVSFGQIWVAGEITGLSRPSSGHWYFSLKDERAQIRCAMFKGFNQNLKFQPKEGDLIIVRAKVSLYEGRGDYQLIVEGMEPAGLGQLQAAFEALKLKLLQEGLFDPAHKKPIPEMPKRVAVITSPTGAVIHDIISVTKRRFPALEIILLPVSVQGDSAAGEIAAAIALANRLQLADVLIVGRGGGSLEDLWAFNEELVARAIFNSEIPVVSAVGHEVDFTIADWVADYRAPTPSAAAEKITPDQFELMQRLDQQQRRLSYFMQHRLDKLAEQLSRLSQRLKHPGETLREREQRLTELTARLRLAVTNRLTLVNQQLQTCRQTLFRFNPAQQLQWRQLQLQRLTEQLIHGQRALLEAQQHRLAIAAQTLHTASPLATLGRGYAIVRDAQQNVVSHYQQVNPGDRITALLQEGQLSCTVIQSLPTKPA